ncbi:hypothetical protein R5W23_005440 [Gemmata sp. JC673]|uniref:Uncharacterized protein n=1 Tax=Gemmata algarum TaxID=2975278 RepID=A0ABU5FBQ0_9BACT|nr:hypothetical protein [Gemmata algarum]MDY3563818.1 hypothetical protein [Gemmata algarum]
MAQRVIEFVSPLPPEVCEARLRSATARPGLFAWLDSRPVLGTVKDRWVSLSKRGGRNHFRPFLSGRLEPCAGGTVLRCRVDLPLFARVLFGVFLFLSTLVALAGGVSFLSTLADGRAVHLGMLGPSVPLAVALVSWFHDRYLARAEDQFLIGFTARTLGAEWRELERESLVFALKRLRASMQPRPSGVRGDDQPDWVPSFPLLLLVGAVAVVVLVCAGVPVLMVIVG